MKLIALTAALLLGNTLTGVQITAVRVDWVEREITGNGHHLFTTFITVHQIGGRTVTAAEFWRKARTGQVIQAKVAKRAGLSWAARINIKETR